MTAKPPTPQSISALLNRAGFDRAEVKMRSGRSGFIVTKGYDSDGTVRVRWNSWSMGAPRERHHLELTKYAEAITAAGWTVEAGQYELVVTAKPSSGQERAGEP